MKTLQQMECTVCRANEPTLDETGIAALMPQTPNWRVIQHDGIKRLERVFEFADFAQALLFTNKVGALAESVGHHPVLLTQWGSVTVTWWTHKIGGLHRNDFVMAARTDALAASAGPGTEDAT